MEEIKANELRLGNYLQCWDSERFFELTFEDLTIINDGGSKCKPIPLTEQWLLDFGAYQESLISEKDSLLIDVTENISIGWCGYLFLLIEGMIIQINDANSIYIHQLQNLYFSLKNTELTLKK